MLRRWGLLLIVASGSCVPVQAPAVPASAQSRYFLPLEASDTAFLCAVTPINVPFNDCKSVGEVRAFLRSVKAEP